MTHAQSECTREPFDPTRNVADLVRETNRRQDDLRNLDAAHIREVWEIRSFYDDRLRMAEALRIDQRAESERERLDAIRKVDAGNVAAAAVVQSASAATLANTVGVTAEASRATIAAAASAAAIALRAETDPLRKDIAELRQVQYETAGGKQQVTEGRAETAHWGLWIGLGIAGLAAFTTLTLGVVGIVITLLVTL